MAKNDLHSEGAAPDDSVSEAPTGEVPDIIALEPEQGAESDTVVVEQSAGGGGDDVYVILPEGEASDIPVVETQVLDEVDTAAETTPLGGDPSVSNVAVLDRNPALDDTQSTDISAGEDQETQSLDDLATELDEEVLASERASDTGDTSIDGAPVSARRARPEREPEAPHSLGSVSEAPFERKRSIFKVAMPIAAAVLLSAGGYFYFFGGGWDGTGTPGGASTSVASAGTAATQAGATGGSDGQGGVNAVPRPADALAAAKQSFREKVFLALELGFGGEVKNE
jgi:hypothetical protein